MPRARRAGEVAAVWRRCVRRWWIVSVALEAERVVGRRTRWAVRGWVVRKVSIMRSQMPRPTPLGEEEVD